jgi:hypothetical protein
VKSRTVTLTALLGFLSLSAACDREPGEASTAELALVELQRLVEETREGAPEDAVEWAREDLDRYGDWEYQVLTLAELDAESLQAELNALGQERWELFWIDSAGQGLILLLKRPAVSYLRAVPFSQIGRAIPGNNGN